jgi:hexosaminidase
MLGALVVILATFSPWGVHGLWPIPRSLQTGTTLLKLSPTFDIRLSVTSPPQDLLDAVSRTKSFIQTDKLQRLIVGRGASDSAALETAPTLPGLSLSLLNSNAARAIAVEAVQAVGTRSEGYSLAVPTDGTSAILTANSTLGLFRGLTTFEQLWYDSAGVTYSYQAPVKIVNDIPAFVSTGQ